MKTFLLYLSVYVMMTLSFLLKSPLIFIGYGVILSIIKSKGNKKGFIEITKSQVTLRYVLFNMLMLGIVMGGVFITLRKLI